MADTRGTRRRENAEVVEVQHAMRLGGVLADLVRQHGLMGAATELGISYKTLQRSRAAGQMSRGLRDALEQYLSDGPEQGSAWWSRVEALESGMRELKERANGEGERLERAVERLLEDVTQQVAGLDTRLGALGKQIKEVREMAVRPATEPEQTVQSRREPLASDDTQGEMLEAESPPRAGLSSGVRMETKDTGATEDAAGELAAKWSEAKAAEAAARTRLARAKASEAVLELEMNLIHRHGLSIPPGELWDPVRRSREIDRRWYGLEAVRRERIWLGLRRWARRLLTLGMWWG